MKISYSEDDYDACEDEWWMFVWDSRILYAIVWYCIVNIIIKHRLINRLWNEYVKKSSVIPWKPTSVRSLNSLFRNVWCYSPYISPWFSLSPSNYTMIYKLHTIIAHLLQNNERYADKQTCIEYVVSGVAAREQRGIGRRWWLYGIILCFWVRIFVFCLNQIRWISLDENWAHLQPRRS